MSSSELMSPKAPIANRALPASPADAVPNAIYINGLPSDCTEVRYVFVSFTFYSSYYACTNSKSRKRIFCKGTCIFKLVVDLPHMHVFI
jgi:hypothetical protein